MPTAEISWEEWHLTDGAAIDTCAEDLYNGIPSFRSQVGRMRDGDGNEIRTFSIIRPVPDNTTLQIGLGNWVVLVAGLLQVMTPDEYAAWRS